MGRPAARLTDMHVCPMATGLVPHVGGPISGPCCPTVLIGGLPAARVSDLLVCVGPPDVIAMGSTGVFIGGLPAARLADPTAHGGTIVMGWPTVLIGEVGGGGGGGGAGGGAAGGGGGGGDSGQSGGAAAALPGPGQASRMGPGPKVAAALAVLGALRARRAPALSATPDFRVAHSTPPMAKNGFVGEVVEKITTLGTAAEAALDFTRQTIGKITLRSIFRELRVQNMPANKAFFWGKHFAASAVKNSRLGVGLGVVGIAVSATEAVGATVEAVRTKEYEAKVEASSKAMGAIASFGTSVGAAVGAAALVAVAVPTAPVWVSVAVATVAAGVVAIGTKKAWDKWGSPRFKNRYRP